VKFVSHAQNFEDVLLWRALGQVRRGRYLDIGAQDPVQDSVSLAFYERGWRGIHVEPTPAYAQDLREARPDELVIEAAVSADPGPIEFYIIPETGLSTGLADIAARHQVRGYAGQRTLVPTVRLDQLLSRAGELHWLKIDVEGMEADVLASWGDHPGRPWIVVIEATSPMEELRTDARWRDQLQQRGYAEVHFDGLSRYFVHSDHAELAEAFVAPPNVFDRFFITERHFAAELLWSELTGARGALEQARAERVATEQREAKLAAAVADANARTEQARQQQLAALESAAAAERDHRATLNRFENDRRELEGALRDRIDTDNRELRALAEELATFRERSAQLTSRNEVQEQELLRREQAEVALRCERDQQARRVEELAASLAQADDLIRRALAQPKRRRTGMGFLSGREPEDPVRSLLRQWHAHQTTSFIPGSVDVSFAPSRPERNPYLRASSLAELLSWHDLDFVRCAYVTMLGRQPDEDGESFFTYRLRQGHSKLEVLGALRRSPEGAGHDPGIAGLDRKLRRAAWARRRLVGGLVRWYTGLEGDTPTERRHRAILNELGLVREGVGQLGRHLADVRLPSASPTQPDDPAAPDRRALDPATISAEGAAVYRLLVPQSR
jgi:FkbM family methyltransferase